MEGFPTIDPNYRSAPGDRRSVIPRGTAVLESGEVVSPVMVLKKGPAHHPAHVSRAHEGDEQGDGGVDYSSVFFSLQLVES